ncbi:MAG: transglutaminase family protein [Opitutaceae bacterium]|nr:transglutaminase family protein [Opitutaceae bacterium]
MHIRFGYDIAYDFPVPTPVVLMLHLRPELTPCLVVPEEFKVVPDVPIRTFRDDFGNHCTRLLAPAGLLELRSEGLIRRGDMPERIEAGAAEVPVMALPSSVLPFLLPSRYCEVDLLGDVAWSRFGAVKPGWSRVQAVSDWVHHHLRFDYAQARLTRTAAQAYEERTGVCRDFTHLAITLCRCLNIPARYATGYLGDIGVPPDPAPMDFSAWMEVYLDSRWHIFDVRHNARRIGHLVMARGRDAADVAFTTSFGPHLLRRFVVRTEEVAEAAVAA